MIIEQHERHALIAARIAQAWPGTALAADPVPLAGGFWASMFRLRLVGQPAVVPEEVVFRIAPDAAMGAKELAVQQSVADLGFPTPRVRLVRTADEELGGAWSVMDFALGRPPLGDLDGVAALRRAPRLLARLPAQLAGPMAQLHALDPDPVSAAVEQVAPNVAWRVDDVLVHFERGADRLGRSDLAAAARALHGCRPPEGATVICHGDLHPFNLLVADDALTVVDWTGAILAEPAFDVAFTELLLANPPLDMPGPLGGIVRRVGAVLARRFVARYRALAPASELSTLDWYRALQGLRLLVEAASLDAGRDPGDGLHPFTALAPAAAAALGAVTGAAITTRR